MSLKIGDKIPFFTSISDSGNEFDIKDVIGKKNVVIYFYPKNFTPGCTKEACSFRDAFEDFVGFDTEIIGVSSDSVASHQEFKKAHRLPFTLLADEKSIVQKLFGVKKRFFILTGRETFVVNKKGEIVYHFNSMFDAEKHIELAIQKLKELN